MQEYSGTRHCVKLKGKLLGVSSLLPWGLMGPAQQVLLPLSHLTSATIIIGIILIVIVIIVTSTTSTSTTIIIIITTAKASCIPGWCKAHCIAEAGLDSYMLRLQECTRYLVHAAPITECRTSFVLGKHTTS